MDFNVEEIFKKPNHEYKPHIDPVNDYIEQTSYLVSKYKNIPIDKAKELVRNKLSELKKEGKVRNPKVKFKERDLEGNVTTNVTSLMGYINYVKQSNDILVPSFTVYFNPKKKKSLHSEFISANVKSRNEHKKLMFKYKMEGDIEKSNYHKVIQSTKKIFNNSLSGAYASPGTVLYNPSAHYTLTSITRCVSGIGNAISEYMILDNRHYRDPDVTMAHLNALVSMSDLDLIGHIVEKYNLYIPTVDEIMNDIVIENIKPYWRAPKYEQMIYKYLKSLDYRGKAAITYINSFYNLRRYNDKFVRELFDKVLKHDLKLNENAKDIVTSLPSWVFNLAMHVLIEDAKGIKPVVDEMPLDLVEKIAKVGKTFLDNIIDLKDLIQAFYVTNIFPPSIAYIKDSTRKVIVLSDTDSTCATYQDWAYWYQGSYDINPTSIGVTAIVMTFTTQAIDHYIKTLGVNMNIDPGTASVLKMKNEFFWDVFVNTDASKHYYAQVRIQEGNVFKEPDLEKKGVNLIASQIHPHVRKEAENMMKDILATVSDNKNLRLDKYISWTRDLEKFIIDKVNRSETDIFKLMKIKELTAYKNSDNPGKTPYFNHLVWEEVFADKYGRAPEPTYLAVKISTTINSNKDFEDWLKTQDKEFATKLRNIVRRYGKTEIKTFILPLVNVKSKGIPEELRNIIDVDRLVKDNCNVLYLTMTGLSIYNPPDIKYVDKYEEGNENEEM